MKSARASSYALQWHFRNTFGVLSLWRLDRLERLPNWDRMARLAAASP